MTASETLISTPIVSTLLPSGDQLELIRKGEETLLLRWSGGKTSTCNEFQFGQRRFTPGVIGEGLPSEIRLATGISDYSSVADLFDSISGVFKSIGGLDTNNSDLAASFVFATYFPDCRDPAPRAVVTGIDPWEALQFLKLLGCFCRHAIAATFEPQGVTLPGCSPTFLISDPGRFRARLRFLNATHFHEFGIAQGQTHANMPFSAAILQTDRDLGDLIPNTFCRINATPHIRPQLIDAEALRKIAEAFQPQLLLYRLKNRVRVASVSFDPSSLSGATRALASVLGACFPDCEKLQNRVVQLLKPQDEERRLDQGRCESAVVLEALLVACHEKRPDVHVGDISNLANGILNLRGDGYQLTPRKVGVILRSLSLGLHRDSHGYGFLLSTECKLTIHRLALRFDVPFFRGPGRKCAICKRSSPTDR